MERDISFVLLVTAGVLLLILIVFSVRAKLKQRYQNAPEFGPLDDLIDDDFDLFASQAPTQQKNFRKAVEPIVGDPLAEEMSYTHRPVEVLAEPEEEFHFEAEPQTIREPKAKPDILVLNVMAQPGEDFVGYELLQALLATGLRFGDMSIFHRHEKPTGEGKILFSLAQATEPGIFDMNAMGACHCNGLTLFMRLAGAEHNLETFNLFMDTANQLAEDLGGIVTDVKRQPLNPQLIDEYRHLVIQHQHAYQ